MTATVTDPFPFPPPSQFHNPKDGEETITKQLNELSSQIEESFRSLQD